MIYQGQDGVKATTFSAGSESALLKLIEDFSNGSSGLAGHLWTGKGASNKKDILDIKYHFQKSFLGGSSCVAVIIYKDIENK